MVDKPLIAIVGQTASGKSDLALKLAEQFQGEIICADSRTVYRGMDIGTAKPTKEDQARVPHHIIDVVYPDEPFTAADFKDAAEAAIKDIHSRGKVPFLVGGTGLYVDSIIFNYSFSPIHNPQLRQELEAMTLDELVEYAHQEEIFLGGINTKNKRHLVRAIERGGVVEGQSKQLRDNTLVLALQHSAEVLGERIVARIDVMIEHGFIDEALKLAKQYGWEYESHTIYSVVREYENQQVDLEFVKAELAKKHRNLAKRQATWFKRNNSIHWLDDPSRAVDLVTTFLNKSA